MISNITDNYFIDIHISPRNGHYHTSLLPQILLIQCILQHLRCDEIRISLTPPTATFIFTHMIWKDTHTYQLLIPINTLYTTNKRTEFFVNIMLTDHKWGFRHILGYTLFPLDFHYYFINVNDPLYF